MTQPLSEELGLSTAAVELSPVAQVVVDADGIVIVVNDRARDLFGLLSNDIGRPLRDLQFSYRPIELRSLIEQAAAERRPVVVKEIEWPGILSERRWIDLHVAPLTSATGAVTGTVLTFTDVTIYRRLQRELE